MSTYLGFAEFRITVAIVTYRTLVDEEEKYGYIKENKKLVITTNPKQLVVV